MSENKKRSATFAFCAGLPLTTVDRAFEQFGGLALGLLHFT
jgi:hypothetical protein